MTAAHPPSLPLTFSGGQAVVTGAAAGIGAAIAGVLMAAGVPTVRLDIRLPEPDPRYSADVQRCVAADVGDPDLAGTLAGSGIELNTVGYLVNCAGIIENTGFGNVTQQAWLRCLQVNLVGAYNVLDALTPALRRSPSAAVVNISSIEGFRVIALSDPDPTPQYAASKAGLHMLTQSAARALAADGIRVNSVSPGFTATAMAAAHGSTDQLPPALAPRVPAGRFADPTDIAHAVAFLLSDQAAYITGTDLRVDGGFQLT
ncbi:SDR family NAD(P)-dependent oxidoreductase [Mycobacterium sp. GA-2829]|uniref:SDR family NAD(P)-dependent oxidoreductase n=1 Tax=Mycobacterium sp. GA-2829 TaxID=1772283 RepID=UPI00073FB9BA|nr:SDR family oxidoreductase [Mycobacterium sp. GA-2829]KUI34650.1 3-oxoacyl-ACP reductase [Mycobacterium sp. GA-2829]